MKNQITLKSVGRFIRETREDKKLALRAVGRLAKVDCGNLSRLEAKGHYVSATTLRSILGALGITPNSPEYIEAFALYAADSSLAADAGVQEVRKKMTKATANARSAIQTAEETALTHYRALTTSQRATIDKLLENPSALKGLKLPTK